MSRQRMEKYGCSIGILGCFLRKGVRKTLHALCEIYNARLEEQSQYSEAGIDAWILPNATKDDIDFISRADRPYMAIIRNDELVSCGDSSVIQFSKHLDFLSVFKGKQITTDEAIRIKALPKWVHNSDPVLVKEGCPIWVANKSNQHQHHISSLSIPELADGEPIFSYFNGKKFLRLLPLILFLRSLGENTFWNPPSLRATFMMDDPNLHWTSYGYVNFSEVCRHAQKHNYHLSFATIPLDSWFVHKSAAFLFKRYKRQISLLVHGNDHIAQELGREYLKSERTYIANQALSRISKMEERSGLEVAKVMAPPHGACTAAMLNELAEVGFNAACISSGSLYHHNVSAKWINTIGIRPCDRIGGLPVFPRFRLSMHCYNSILIAALLNQPIIPVGHHYDIRDGLQLLENIANFINSIGRVDWTNMKEISLSHYLSRKENESLYILMLTNHIELKVPAGIKAIIVSLSYHQRSLYSTLAWRLKGIETNWNIAKSNELISVLPRQVVEIIYPPTKLFLGQAKSNCKISLWPFIRRQLTEVRDRLAPILRYY